MTEDTYHTMDELYEYRMVYHALWVNGRKDTVKSWQHSDGELCFGGGWFIVVTELPEGQISNHYSAEHWDLFRVPEVKLPPEYDGHTPQQALSRMLKHIKGFSREEEERYTQLSEAIERGEVKTIPGTVKHGSEVVPPFTLPAVTAVAAVADNGVIGYDGSIPWKFIPEDMERFKKMTKGAIVIMGRKTMDSIGHPLKDRTNVVLTRNKEWSMPGVFVMDSLLETILAFTHLGRPIFILGGEQVYRQAELYLTGLYITEVHVTPRGDAWFPIIDKSEWVEVSREDRDGYSFVKYGRIPSSLPGNKFGGIFSTT